MKDKMRCARCGKTFKQARSNQTMCEQCEKQERAARAAAKSSGATRVSTVNNSPTPVRIVGPAAGLIDPAAPAPSGGSLTPPPPPDTLSFGMDAWREEQRRQQRAAEEQRRAEERAAEQARREAEAHERQQRAQSRSAAGPETGGPRAHGAKGVGRKPGPRPERAPNATRPPKERVALPRFVLTDDMRQAIEARYLELAHPVEFDGIRTKIAAEFNIPKAHVKRVVSDLRTRMQLPSWWELQTYTGQESDLDRIRAVYLPLLPVPPVGVHKELAETLGLDPRTVYQGIRRIRAEMRLPQYNPPEAHEDDQSNDRQEPMEPGAPVAGASSSEV